MVPGPVYITQDPGRAILPLRHIDAGHLPGLVPAGRTLLARCPTRGLVSIVGGIPGATPGPETRSSLFTESGLDCEPFFGLGPLAGCGRHVVNYLERRPSIAYRCEIVIPQILRLWLNRLRLPGTAPLRTGPGFTSHGFSPITIYPTSV
jgi:hypothetical protein